MEISNVEQLQHLKRVSRIKHVILEKYLPSWTTILGTTNRNLCYYDCFAGPGVYEFNGKAVGGSPLIAIQAGKEFLRRRPDHNLVLTFIEQDRAQIEQLQNKVESERPFPPHLNVDVINANSRTFVPDLLAKLPHLAPSFFTIDPYGHPLSLRTINEILCRRHTEVLINLMWWRINMDLANPVVQHHVSELFGDENWKGQNFMQESGDERERHFLDYFISRLQSKFTLKFRIRYDPEDQRGGSRTKYYLLHGSNHPRAALLMKDVMWPLGDQEGLFDYSGSFQGYLISMTPREEELRTILLDRFSGKEETFDGILIATWDLPFRAKHYRAVLQQLRKEGRIIVTPVTSKKTGLGGSDRIRFLPKGGAQQ